MIELDKGGAGTEMLDRAVVDKLRSAMGDEAAADVVQSLLDDVPAHLDGLGAAQGRKDATALRLHAHTLKSSSLMVGAAELAQLCGGIEESAAKSELPVAEQVSEVRARGGRLVTALQGLLGELKR